MAHIVETFDELVLHYNVDTLLDQLAKALERQARRDADASRRRAIRAEKKAILDLADRITAGQVY